MTPQELKNSILQLAIQGKLVEQRPEEGTAEELYQQIQAEKQRLIKEKKIKKDKPLPEITEEEKPFEIPESWKWVRFGEVISLLSGTDFNPNEYNDLGVGTPYITGASNLSSEGVIVSRWTETPRIIARRGDILLVCKGSGYGKTVTCDVDEAHIARQIMAVKKLENLNMNFIKSYLAANFKNIKSNGQGVIPGIDRGSILKMAFPLPPLAEQKRIVSKIEDLLPLVDRYEAAWSRLEAFNKRFPEDMQKSILQEAIQGKLVEQRSEEGTGEELYQQIQAEKQRLIKEKKVKKEKPLPEIAEDEKPFEIPGSWKWVRLSALASLITKGSSPKWQGISYTEEKSNGILFITSENVGTREMLMSKEKFVEPKMNEMHPNSILQYGDLLTNIVGASIGRTAIFDIDVDNANINQAVCLVRLVDLSLATYLLMYLNSEDAIKIMTKKSVDSARANLSLTSVSNLIVPLPPLAEQKRIVAKIEELLPLCERLKS